jgi:hypothetical protein
MGMHFGVTNVLQNVTDSSQNTLQPPPTSDATIMFSRMLLCRIESSMGDNIGMLGGVPTTSAVGIMCFEIVCIYRASHVVYTFHANLLHMFQEKILSDDRGPSEDGRGPQNFCWFSIFAR